MKILDKGLDFPVKPHRTWEIMDSSKLKEAMNCRRKYFYRYVLGWVPDTPSIHLVFGSAWHEAMEIMMSNIGNWTNEVILSAHEAFLKEYRKTYGSLLDDQNAPKDPGNALQALVLYSERYPEDKYNVEPLYIEVAGTVPVKIDEETGESRLLHFRLDSINRNQDGQITSLEHKTTGQDSGRFRDQWSLNVQTHTYTHVLYSMFPAEEVYGIIINGAILRKSSNDFKRYPVRKSLNAMQAWLWEVNHYMDLIEWDFYELTKEEESSPVMMSFPRNPEACFKYGKCPYWSFCSAWENPLQKDPNGEPPTGFKREYWDPSAEELDANYKAEVSMNKPSESTIKKIEKKKEQKDESDRKESGGFYPDRN